MIKPTINDGIIWDFLEVVLATTWWNLRCIAIGIWENKDLLGQEGVGVSGPDSSIGLNWSS